MARILLVDDMLDLLDGESQLLEECGMGYEVKGTASPHEALKMLEYGSFDLVILDVRMPMVDGSVILKWVKERSNTPVIIYSAYVDEELSKYLFEEGADAILSKPAPPDLFLNAVITVLQPQTKTSVVIVDGYKIEKVQNGVLERRVQEALSHDDSTLSQAASSLQMSQEYLTFLLNKFHLAG